MEQLSEYPADCQGAGGDDIFDGHDMAVEVWGERAEDYNSSLTAFAYLWRRFGPPFLGSDDYKDLAAYYLTTNDPDVFLWLHLSGAGLKYSVGYLCKKELRLAHEKPMMDWERAYEAWWVEQHPEIDWKKHKKSKKLQKEVAELYWKERHEKEVINKAVAVIGEFPRPYYERGKWREGSEVVQRVNQAIYDALKELERPVYIRDCPINIFGACEDAPGEDDDEDEDDELQEESKVLSVKRSKYAGYGVPKEAMDKLIKDEEKDDNEENE